MLDNALLGGLIGSILTVVITKVLDLLQQSQKHRYSLKQSFFQNKLRSAEAAATQWQLFSNSAGTFEALAKQWNEKPRSFSSASIDLLGRELHSHLESIRQSSVDAANTVMLYFELDDPAFWDSGPLRKLSYHFSALDALQARARDWQGFFGSGSSVPVELSDSITREYNDMQVEVLEHFRALAAAYRELEGAASSVLKELRADLQVFET